MKRNKFCIAAVLLAVSVFASSAHALTEGQIADIKKTIARTPALELTPAAQKMVRAAKADEKADVALLVVRTALAKNPRIAVALVKAVSKEVPQVAAEVAAIAAQFIPSEAAEIARVAASAAPKSAEQIAVSVAKVAPKYAAQVIKAAIVSAPAETPLIVKSVVEAVPSAQTAIEKDATIRVIQSFAKMTQSSATHGGPHGTISVRPGGIIYTPVGEATPTDGQVVTENRSNQFAALINAINAMESRTDLNAAQRSAIANAIVAVANSVITDTGTVKSEQNSTFSSTSAGLNDIIEDFMVNGQEVGGDPKRDAALTFLLGIAAVVSDPETPGDQQVSLVNFIAGQVSNAISQGDANGLTSGEINNVINLAVSEVKNAVSGNTTLTQQQLGQLLVDVTTKVQNTINEYAQP